MIDRGNYSICPFRHSPSHLLNEASAAAVGPAESLRPPVGRRRALKLVTVISGVENMPTSASNKKKVSYMLPQ